LADLSSLEKGLAILRELAGSERGLTVAELAATAGLNRTTTYRLCEMLERGGWLHRVDGEEGAARLDLGPTMHGLTVLVESKYDLEAKLRPIIDGLARSLEETVHVGVLDRAQLVHIAVALPESGMNVAARIGSRESAHVTALGKALMAALPEDEARVLFLDETLPTRTAKTIPTRTRLLEDLDAIRTRGYAVDDEESRMGVFCVGAPAFGPDGRPIVAISVTTVPARVEGDRLPQVVSAVQGAASMVTAAWGGHAPPVWRTAPAVA
jgi:IclR family transcriptional regulator, acetate operon repressor